MNEKNGIEYLETIKYLSNEYALKIVIILYIQNKNFKIDKKILQESLVSIILTYCEKDILNYYNDHFNILTSYKFPKISETKIVKEEDNGWDMKRDININIFDSVKVEKVFGFYRSDIFIRNMYKVYKENNCLDLFIKYYGNYFGADFIVEEGGSNIISS